MQEKRSRKLKTACLGAGLAVAGWGNGAADAATYRVTGSVTPTGPLSNAYVIAQFIPLNSSTNLYFVQNIAANIPSGEATQFEFDISDESGESGVLYELKYYDFLAIHEDDQADRVAVSLSASNAQGVLDDDTAWEDFFPYVGTFGPTESEAMTWLLTDETTRIRGWRSNGWPNSNLFGTESILTEFAPSAHVGSVFAEFAEIPEPATFALVLTGSALCLSRRRRQDLVAG
ncbi:MAG: hypothetical protein DHS20C16_18890 [Phycisphaerae bacterium]|nr:MAG: hypothetical protein DHS20C16_18890 [Phycisphaerae bacterium]